MATQSAIEPEEPVGYGALLLWGSLTLWVYTAFRLCGLLRAHARRRRAELAAGSPASSDPLESVIVHARVHAAVVAAIVVALGSGEAYYEITGTLGPAPWITLFASVSFGASVIGLMAGLFQRLRRHEALEMRLLAVQGQVLDGTVGRVRIAEWNRHESWLVLTGIVSAACIASPAVGVFQMAQVPNLNEAMGLELSRRWVVIVLVAGGLFHSLGTVFLERLVNGHFAFERQAAPMPAAPPARASMTGEPGERVVGLRAVMFTDIKGYSHRMEADEAAALRLLDVHNSIVREAIRQHGGREIKTVGDAFMVLFDSAVQAVRCAVTLQRGLHAYNRRAAAGEEILVRAGIHLGDVVLTAADVFGDTVNLAARLESVAEPGGVCVSAEVHQVVSRRLDLPFVAMGRVPLKNIAHPPEVFALTRAFLSGESGSAA
jgi:class 3 adenylate cyclase